MEDESYHLRIMIHQSQMTMCASSKITEHNIAPENDDVVQLPEPPASERPGNYEREMSQ